ncbi:unnamed protein product [Natator depressus]
MSNRSEAGPQLSRAHWEGGLCGMDTSSVWELERHQPHSFPVGRQQPPTISGDSWQRTDSNQQPTGERAHNKLVRLHLYSQLKSPCFLSISPSERGHDKLLMALSPQHRCKQRTARPVPVAPDRSHQPLGSHPSACIVTGVAKASKITKAPA